MAKTPQSTNLDKRIRKVSELEEKCRKALQYESVSTQVGKNKKAFNQLCALLDFIGDSDGALFSVSSSSKRAGLENYFLAYGLLQLIYARQVSLIKVMETFGLSPPAALKNNSIREARHRVIGHLITTNNGAHVIIRNSLDHNGFEYASYYEAGTERGNIVKYDPMLKIHLKAMTTGLEILFRHLAEIENNRRRAMRKNPLSPVFQGISYCTQCIVAALIEEKYAGGFESNAQILLKAVEQFRTALVSRDGDEWASYKTDHVIEGVRMLQELFPPKDEREKARYQIVADGIDTNVKALIELATEIDEQDKKEIA